MSRTRLLLAAALVALLAVTACGHTVTGTAVGDATASEGNKLDPYGYKNGQCGPLSDASVGKVFNADSVQQQFSGAICYWLIGGGANVIDVQYAFYENGTVARERTAAAQEGETVTDGKISGRIAFFTTSTGVGKSCGVTVGAGDGALSWWVQYRNGGTTDPCDAVRKLGEMTVSSLS